MGHRWFSKRIFSINRTDVYGDCRMKVNALVQCRNCGNKQKFNGKYLGNKKCVYCNKNIKIKDNIIKFI